MAVIITADKWRRQPSGVGTSLDISDSARGVIACYVPSAGYVDIASGKRMQGTASPNFRPGVSGISTQTTGAAGAFIGCPTYGTIASGSDRTVMAVFAIDTYPPSQLASVVGFSNSIPRWSDAVSSWNVLGVGSTGTVQYSEYDGSTKYASGQTISTGKVVCAIGTAVSGVGIRVAVDGVVGSLTSMGTLAAINSAGLASNFTDIYGPSVRHFAGQIYLMCGWNRALSAPELADLSVNPWQIFRKQPRILYFTSAGGGGATITGDSGSYTLTGTAATLKVGRKLTADSGTYSLTGTDVAFKRGYALSAESGTYTVSGTAVDLKAGRKLTADSGSYTLTGTDVTLNYSPVGSYNLTAESGTYTLTGTAATLKVSRKLTADSGAYPLTGTDVTLSKGVKLTADSGSYTLSGSNVAFSRTYVLTAESGAYTLTGTSAGLTWSGAPVVEAPTNGGPSIYGKPVFREKQFRKEYEEQVKRIEDEKRLARILREDEEITVIMALMAA